MRLAVVMTRVPIESVLGVGAEVIAVALTLCALLFPAASYAEMV